MILQSNAKINLGLSILNKRPDGYHNIESLFLPIPWYDNIKVEASDTLKLENTGVKIDGNEEDNLCFKAYQLIKADFEISPVRIEINKKIPIGAGLGGGSSNAAFTIIALNKLFDLKMSAAQMESYAGSLGSDCSFFIKNKPAFVSGKGEILNTHINFNLSTYCVVVFPNFHISSQLAYQKATPNKKVTSLKDLLSLPVSKWQESIVNDFEAPLMKEYKALASLRIKLIEAGAYYVSMSGSGSSFFAFFHEEPSELELNEDDISKTFKLVF